MKNFLLVPNFKRNSLPFVLKAVDFLQKKGCNVFCQEEDVEILRIERCSDFHKIDCFLVFGGDGTMLKSIKKYLCYKKPFAGINTGKVGYLADVDPEKTEKALDLILAGKYSVEERSLLRVELNDKSFLGVNEAVLHRASAHVLGVEIDVNGQRIEPVRADGILVATPTGSTAYNLSAGGPILMPTSKNMVITPVCAHSLSVRPIVIGGEDTVTMSVSNADVPAFVNVDGENVGTLSQGENVDISVAQETFTLLRLSEGSFFTVLRNKLSNWEQ